MKQHVLTRQVWLPHPPRAIFSFFERPENLAWLTPPSLGFRLLTPAVAMGEGAMFEYSIRLLAIPVRWTSLIDSYDPPWSFSDLQIRGPYSFWRHEHRFEPKDGGTLATDEVRYRLPLEPLGRLALPLVSWQLDRIFRFRREAIRAVFPEDESRGRGGVLRG